LQQRQLDLLRVGAQLVLSARSPAVAKIRKSDEAKIAISAIVMGNPVRVKPCCLT
jgi:hypothetical protein